METAKLTIRLPRKDVEFAKGYAKAHGITVTEVIDRLLRGMQTLERTALHPELGCGQSIATVSHSSR